MIKSNIVRKHVLRKVQLGTLKELDYGVGTSFGPRGSNSIIGKELKSADASVASIPIVRYTKDGHSILKEIVFNGMIEDATKADVETVTEIISKTVGDGTSSAVKLLYIIFKELYKIERAGGKSPIAIINDFKAAIKVVQEEILKHKQEFTAETAYKIAYISTNSNEEVAANIRDIYEEHGAGVYIDYAISPVEESMLKVFDGMSLETGYDDSAYMNDLTKKNCTIEQPSIYYFSDPVDTPEMIALLSAIIEHNILTPYRNVVDNKRLPEEHRLDETVIPTVILCKHISRDAGSAMNEVIEFLHLFDNNMDRKPPFLLVSGIHQTAELDDIARMCSCKEIKKYLNPDQQRKEIEEGKAPTPETVWEFAGHADLVESNISGTKFVNPAKMFKEDGTYSDEYQAAISFLECELAKAKEEGEDLNVTGELRRRLNSLKANMVQYFVGGISPKDRDALKDLVEDAVLNCRSAANNGVGFGSNVEGYLAAKHVLETTPSDCKLYQYKEIIFNAYKQLLTELYNTIPLEEEKIKFTIAGICRDHGPFNLVTEEYDTAVLSSIQSDVTILDCISKIVTLMITSSQFILPTPFHNKYGEYDFMEEDEL